MVTNLKLVFIVLGKFTETKQVVQLISHFLMVQNQLIRQIFVKRITIPIIDGRVLIFCDNGWIVKLYNMKNHTMPHGDFQPSTFHASKNTT